MGCQHCQISRSFSRTLWVAGSRSSSAKLTTFVRNRVVNIREKMGLDILYHCEGISNPTDVGTRPNEITADSVRPGSVWLKGKPWMNKSVEQAKKEGVIKHVEDIKLSNDKKKIFGEGVAFDSFDTTGTGVFAVTRVGKRNAANSLQTW